MKTTVKVMLRNGVLDPQGEAVRQALGSLGFEGVDSVRIGKIIELEHTEEVGEDKIIEMCEKILANTVIESYTIIQDILD